MEELEIGDRQISRRQMLRRATLVAGGATATLIGVQQLGASAQDETTTTEAESTTTQITPDTAIAFCAAAERTAKLVVEAALASPLVTSATARTTMAAFPTFHQTQADALNKQTSDSNAGSDNASLTDELVGQISVAADEHAALTIVYDLEIALASTLLNALAVVEDDTKIETMVAVLGANAQQGEALAQPLGLTDELSGPIDQLLEGDFPAFLTVEGSISPTAYPLEASEES